MAQCLASSMTMVSAAPAVRRTSNSAKAARVAPKPVRDGNEVETGEHAFYFACALNPSLTDNTMYNVEFRDSSNFI